MPSRVEVLMLIASAFSFTLGHRYARRKWPFSFGKDEEGQ